MLELGALFGHAGGTFGQTVEVRTVVTMQSEYRLTFQQDVYLQGSDDLLVEGHVELVCVDAAKQLVRLPDSVVARFS